jgi:UDP-N-acetylmuramoyl-L-alanyl-D-glutamate--2,6-diaminopimelate ligase
MLPGGAPAIVNVDDPRGAALAAGRSAVTYAVHRAADVTPGALSLSLDGLAFDATTPAGTLHLRSRLVGQPNVYNILAASAAAVALGLPLDAVERGIAALAGVPGRFELVTHGEDDLAVVVDYAHTDDALKNLLETARSLAPRRVITVFGFGGDRDRTKRPLMGAVASRLSDVVVVTSDNPRSEDPGAIVDEILLGIPGGIQEERRPARGSRVLRVIDRRAAIERAVDLAEPGDLVVIAGKGHEKTQTTAQGVFPFDDVEVARATLREHGFGEDARRGRSA